MSPTHKTVLITGCSTGIGASLVRTFASHINPKTTVYATARNLSSLKQFADLPNVHCFALDVTSTVSVQACVEAVEKHILSTSKEHGNENGSGGLDYVINNAGMGYDMPVLDIDIEEAKKVYETNVWGVLRVVQGVSGMLVKAHGTVVVVGTAFAWMSWPFKAVYSTSKASTTLLAETLRLELAPLGVNVLTIATTGIASNFLGKLADSKLPPTSLYREIETQFRSSAVMSGTELMATDKYTAQVVEDVLGGKKGIVWRGASAFAARLAVAGWLPQWVVVSTPFFFICFLFLGYGTFGGLLLGKG
ncbi:unnamed protein product [Periconia digitata]|uniref:NAD(P)-binding protein n=1 Tax=Periconia digitata TaxID=1303443 RepID=A0A9W4U6G0_9PLEO|nr:unnamed protein product [Periconia digitata]